MSKPDETIIFFIIVIVIVILRDGGFLIKKATSVSIPTTSYCITVRTPSQNSPNPYTLHRPLALSSKNVLCRHAMSARGLVRVKKDLLWQCANVCISTNLNVRNMSEKHFHIRMPRVGCQNLVRSPLNPPPHPTPGIPPGVHIDWCISQYPSFTVPIHSAIYNENLRDGDEKWQTLTMITAQPFIRRTKFICSRRVSSVDDQMVARENRNTNHIYLTE